LEDRVAYLENLCKTINNDLDAIKFLLEKKDQDLCYVTDVEPFTEDGREAGYIIHFSDGSSIRLYHGKDGEDGADGKDGADGEDGADGRDGVSYTPVFGVKQDTDGYYYWTIDGEWLLDSNGDKVCAEGRNGDNGVTPLLKIENDQWMVSYDGGDTWEELGRATGGAGEDGDDGKDSANGNSLFVASTLAITTMSLSLLLMALRLSFLHGLLSRLLSSSVSR
jgi:hypothetical protein